LKGSPNILKKALIRSVYLRFTIVCSIVGSRNFENNLKRVAIKKSLRTSGLGNLVLDGIQTLIERASWDWVLNINITYYILQKNITHVTCYMVYTRSYTLSFLIFPFPFLGTGTGIIQFSSRILRREICSR
jgi:hypothetical protein